jgi:hypothetical protein
MSDFFDDQLEVFFGEATIAQARVYARLRRGNWPADAKLTGTFTGPTCPYADTLPATYRFLDRGPGDTFLAETVVPDPCFWTPRMPYLYQVEIELRQGGVVLARASRPFAIRPLGVKGKNLLFEGKRWVLRGGIANQVNEIDLAAWHDAEVAMLLHDVPDEKLLALASKIGVLLVVSPSRQIDDARRLARHAAVGLIVLPLDSTNGPEIAKIAPNLVRTSIGGTMLDMLPSGIQVVMPAAITPDHLPEILNRFEGPVIPARCGVYRDPQEVRAACDRLQRELAPFGDFAGYIA